MREESEAASDRVPSLPEIQQRMPVTMLAGPHPATLPVESLLEQCELRTQRRSGPGGQHRNKTSSGAFLLHRPTEIVAEATERRSQAENREVALARLRLRLAVERRTASILDGPVALGEQEIHERTYGQGLKIAPRNPMKPAVLALVLNDLYASGGQPSAVAPHWNTTTSSVVRFLKTHPPAFVLLNAIRHHHGRGPLK
jgi:hypothetical protein